MGGGGKEDVEAGDDEDVWGAVVAFNPLSEVFKDLEAILRD